MLTSSEPGRSNSLVSPRELPVLIEGIETDLDRFLFEHFTVNVSRVLSMFTEKSNPFKELLLPMATSHRGLMHSLLCLSGSHLLARQGTGDVRERQHYHFDCAIRNLRTDPNVEANASGDATAIIDDPTVAQTLVLCLKSICEGDVNGGYRPHMDAARHLVMNQQSPNHDFQNFLVEFFIYHDVSNSITSLDRRSVLMMEDFQLPPFIIQASEAGAFLGVLDGLFGCLSKIRKLRDTIRWRRSQELRPLVDYQILCDAQVVDATLRSWVCTQPPDTDRWTASMLYRQCTWLYLHRTIKPSRPDDHLREAVEEGIAFLNQLSKDSSTWSIMLMPTFILGCSTFDEENRGDILQAFDKLQAYSTMGNIAYAKKIVEKVWQLMDAGDESSWDWETLIKDMGWDFLIT